MKKRWTITKLIAVGGLSVLKLLITVLIYTTALTATGNIFSGILALIISPFFIVFTVLTLDKFGSGIIYNTLRTVLELPLPMIYPVLANFIVAPIVGFIIDILYTKLKNRERLFAFLGGFAYNFIQIAVAIILYFTVGLSGRISIPHFLLTPIWLVTLVFLMSLLGGAPGLLALTTYKRIKNTSVVKRIQN